MSKRKFSRSPYVYLLAGLLIILSTSLAIANDEHIELPASNFLESSCDSCLASESMSTNVSSDATTPALSEDSALPDQSGADSVGPARAADVGQPEILHITGPNAGDANMMLTYRAMAMNREGGFMTITFDLDGDKRIIRNVNSRQWVKADWRWSSCGSKRVRVMARDEKTNEESDWSKSIITVIETKPDTPDRPLGPNCLKRGVAGTFTFKTFDLCNNLVRYHIEWGDGSSLNTGYIEQGRSVTATHSWKKYGNYNIRVKAINYNYRRESHWSSPKSICIRQ